MQANEFNMLNTFETPQLNLGMINDKYPNSRNSIHSSHRFTIDTANQDGIGNMIPWVTLTSFDIETQQETNKKIKHLEDYL